jgi:hypothetical protein
MLGRFLGHDLIAAIDHHLVAVHFAIGERLLIQVEVTLPERLQSAASQIPVPDVLRFAGCRSLECFEPAP